MAVTCRVDVLNQNRGLRFSLRHFARGTYQIRGYYTLSLNRLLFFECGGAGSFIHCCGRRVVPEFGTICLIPAGIAADVTLDDQTHFVSVQFHLDLFQGPDLIGRTGIMRTLQAPHFLHEAIALYESPSHRFPGIRLQEMLLRVFDAMDLHFPENDTMAAGPDFAKTLDAIANRGDARLTIGDLAELEGMPRGSFSRSFSRKFGISAKKYMENSLMRQAESLLLQPRMNVRQTAERLHFSNEFYFSRFFKKHARISPSEFQRLFALT